MSSRTERRAQSAARRAIRAQREGTFEATASLLRLAPEMAEAILAWGKGSLDTAAPLLKECYYKLNAIGGDDDQS